MKKIIYTLFFLIISASFFQANSQTVIMSSVNSNELKLSHIKTIESKYIDSKVYLHITVNGNTETKMVAVERSLDAINYEVIGYLRIIGATTQFDLAYYFTDESPITTNLYYRLSDYSLYNEPAYSETINVMPFDENKALTDILAISPIINKQEQTNSLSGATK